MAIVVPEYGIDKTHVQFLELSSIKLAYPTVVFFHTLHVLWKHNLDQFSNVLSPTLFELSSPEISELDRDGFY